MSAQSHVYNPAVPVFLQNITDVPQRAFIGQTYEVLQAYETRPLPADWVKAFLEQRSKYVREAADEAVPNIHGEPLAWVANMTGNPFIPAILKRSVWDKATNQEIEQEYPNPMKKAVPVQRTMGRGEYYTPADGQNPDDRIRRTFPKQIVTVMPYSRKPLPLTCADWFVNRQGLSGRPSAVICRSPTNFEPNQGWELNEIRAYAALVDRDNIEFFEPTAPTGTMPAEFYKSHLELQEAKTKLLNVLFFRIIDDMYALPNKEQFDDFKALFQKEVHDTLNPKVPVAKK